MGNVKKAVSNICLSRSPENPQSNLVLCASLPKNNVWIATKDIR